uniref:Lactate/malate dehydrogenase C-terminal domain-containing protein n=1 Tax=Panagrolaimus sp. PS1159 TaxID=55785 RepID=A0AC35FY11_9BILA
MLKLDVNKTVIPVIGGHSGVTIIPLLSQCQPSAQFRDSEIEKITAPIQDAGTEVVKAKASAGSATLSIAFAGALFVDALISDVDYFSTSLELGPNGVEKVLGYDKLSSYEKSLVKAAVPELQKNIAKGVRLCFFSLFSVLL